MVENGDGEVNEPHYLDEVGEMDPNNATILDWHEVAKDTRVRPVETCPQCGRKSVAGPIVCKGYSKPENKGRLYKFVSETRKHA